ncbi:IspD/TarI family cytidylyltransferase [Nocardioides terrisoli]|uniref:IspD/TarI family cytidylyltransferase n=1 Tax=Nocardioides terrisoli TaxID=3388267 RepID=UPI00287BA71B|nr:IspD/TarI family cytidylyltransferase [Nocardioides marmorisolisilvae]
MILAGGSGTRVGAGMNKALLPLAGIALVAHSVRTALEVDGVHRIVLVVRAEDREEMAAAVSPYLGTHDVWMVDGGPARHDSEWQALQLLARDVETEEIDVVAIHDAARPLATATLFRDVLDSAARNGAAIPVVPAGSLSTRDGARVAADLVAVQTPQAFRAPALLAAYRQAAADGFTGTDTAACLERYTALGIAAVPSTSRNLKVTFPEDVALAERLLGR